MSLAAKLQQRQSQSLVMTPQLMQAIRLLQMSGAELERYLDGEIEQNPLLSREDGAADDAAAEDAPPAVENAAAPDAAPDEAFDDAGAEAAADEAWPVGGSREAGSAASAPGGEAGRPIEERLAAEDSLEAHIERQIDSRIAAADRPVARLLLAHLDAAGYLTADLGRLAADLSVPPGRIERVLEQCQRLEPTGIFARSLGECLALQLAERDRLDPAMRALLDNLALLAARNLPALRLRCGVDADDLADMIAEIRALDPKPGLAFGHEPARAVVPDVLVRRAADGGWLVTLNEATLPRLLVAHDYRARLGRAASGAEARQFIADCMSRANWLARSLDQRARTILKVATEIVSRQEEFLLYGLDRLRPLNLRMVADAVGVHESTVSRAVAGKIMATPRGSFEMRFFFTGALAASGGGETHSAEAVKHRIRRLVQEEKPDAVLSDDAIAALLAAAGIGIARRTVAKYREMLGIPSSAARRRAGALSRVS